MRGKTLSILALVGIATIAICAQPPPVGDAMATVKTVADRLGMLRTVQPPGGTLRGVNGILFVAHGTMATPQAGATWPTRTVSKLTTEVTYYRFSQGMAVSPGMRWDFTLAAADGKPERQVQVAAGSFAWNETEPGGTAIPAMETADERLREIWLTPQGLIWAALTPDGKGLANGVTVSQEGHDVVLTIPENGTPVKVTLDVQNRPARVETRVKDPVLGDTAVETTYSGYRDFENAYGVFFPTRIVQKLGGHTVLDLTVTEFHTNPYVVFPVPANVSGQGAQ
jgi:hypothetical protein